MIISTVRYARFCRGLRASMEQSGLSRLIARLQENSERWIRRPVPPPPGPRRPFGREEHAEPEVRDAASSCAHLSADRRSSRDLARHWGLTWIGTSGPARRAGGGCAWRSRSGWRCCQPALRCARRLETACVPYRRARCPNMPGPACGVASCRPARGLLIRAAAQRGAVAGCTEHARLGRAAVLRLPVADDRGADQDCDGPVEHPVELSRARRVRRMGAARHAFRPRPAANSGQ